MKEIANTALHIVNARSSLVQAALSLQKVKPNTFDPTIKEIKETIGDLSCSIFALQDFLEKSDQ
jgi:hypothetical protein